MGVQPRRTAVEASLALLVPVPISAFHPGVPATEVETAADRPAQTAFVADVSKG